MRIFLIGFMGSGKSHIGKRLAPKMGYEFIDLDQLIEANANKKISEIFKLEGEEYFRQLESTTLKSLGQKDKIIISTGGGTPCFFDNMEWMKAHGKTIFLDVATTILVDRLLPRTAHRPLLAEKSSEEITSFIEKKLAARRKDYEQSEIILVQKEVEMDRVAALIKLLAIGI